MNSLDNLSGKKSETMASFRMVIDDTFLIKDRGPLIFGKVQSGVLHVGDEIEIVTKGGQHITTSVAEIDFFHKKIDMAEPGQMIGIVLANRDITRSLLDSCREGLVLEAGAASDLSVEPGSDEQAIQAQSDSMPSHEQAGVGQDRIAIARRETLQLLCMGCGRKYILGVDAIVTTPEDVISKVGSWLGGMPSASLYPDIVGPLGKPSPQDDDQPTREQEVIRALQEAIQVGTSRKWRCSECGHVQEYAPISS